MIDSHPRLLACRGLLRIGGIPARATIRELHHAGFHDWVNVSGVDIAAIHPGPALQAFRIHAFAFADRFSAHPPADIPAHPAPDPLRHWPAEERAQYRAAVTTAVACLRARRPLFVFCHYGQGRSPAVSLAALHLAWAYSLDQARECVAWLRPQAKIGPVTLAAARWLAETGLR